MIPLSFQLVRILLPLIPFFQKAKDKSREPEDESEDPYNGVPNGMDEYF